MYHEFNYYPGDIHMSRPAGVITLWKMLQAIKNPSDTIKNTLHQIQAARVSGDKTEKDRLKTTLPAFTPCVLVNGRRRYSDIARFTGLLMLDFDKLPDEGYAKEFRNDMFGEYPFIYAGWLSASGLGVRFAVAIPQVKNVDQFKGLYRGIEQEMLQYIGYDQAPKNCILPLFIAHDPGLLYRTDPANWTDSYTPPQPPPVKQYVIHAGEQGKIEQIIIKAIDKITDNGHPQLRAAAYALGGYVGAGYIDQHHAVSLIHRLIEHNNYLAIKPSVYKKTASEMIAKGQREPLYIN